ncbi:MAG: hypothetical protein SH850_08800, partial [Planctomycetaceae bacterium]|nr:hypothetical protein [Planctomycetaceae bacterium]
MLRDFFVRGALTAGVLGMIVLSAPLSASAQPPGGSVGRNPISRPTVVVRGPIRSEWAAGQAGPKPAKALAVPGKFLGTHGSVRIPTAPAIPQKLKIPGAAASAGGNVRAAG